MKRASRHMLTIISASLAFGVAGLWLFWSGSLPGSGETYEVHATVPSAITVSPGANVRIAGVSVGRVDDVELDGRSVALRLRMDTDHGALPVDSRVGIRLRSLVGENYVEIVPGSKAETIPSGGIIPPEQANDYVDIDQILSALKGKTRQRARTLLQDLGSSVGPRGGQVNDLVRGASDFVEEGSNLAALLDGDRQHVARLVDNLGVLTRQVASRGTELRSFARDARGTFTSLARRDDALRAVLDELPGTLRQARSTSAVLRSTTGDIAPVLTNLAAAIDDVRPAVRSLTPAAREGQRLMGEISAAAPPLRRVVDRLQRAAKPLTAVLPGTKGLLCQVRPMLAYLAPYAKDVTSLVQGMASATNYYDANGHAARLYVAIGADSPTVKSSEVVDKVLNAGIFDGVHLTGWNPYPQPGKADDTATGARRAGPGERGPYTRINAAC